MTNNVIAKDWKVFSRHKAIVEPRLPAANALTSVTACTRTIWPVDTPPKRAMIMSSGNAAITTTTTDNIPASSFPKTSSEFERFVSSSRSRVFRSFSSDTADATSNAANGIATASSSGARI
jgi:hypothetical protein